MYALLLPNNGQFFLVGPFKTADLALEHHKAMAPAPNGGHWRLAPLNKPTKIKKPRVSRKSSKKR